MKGEPVIRNELADVKIIAPLSFVLIYLDGLQRLPSQLESNEVENLTLSSRSISNVSTNYNCQNLVFLLENCSAFPRGRKDRREAIQSTDTFPAMDIRHCVEIAPFNYTDQSEWRRPLPLHPSIRFRTQTSGHVEPDRFYRRQNLPDHSRPFASRFHLVSFEILNTSGLPTNAYTLHVNSHRVTAYQRCFLDPTDSNNLTSFIERINADNFTIERSINEQKLYESYEPDVLLSEISTMDKIER